MSDSICRRFIKVKLKLKFNFTIFYVFQLRLGCNWTRDAKGMDFSEVLSQARTKPQHIATKCKSQAGIGSFFK